MPGHASTPKDFDAYHKWLGIPPAEQPPHFYRLLGLALFESDPDVIAAAADRQMAHVKSFAAGRNGAASQALLNELARARVTLLNERQKAEYDLRLDAPHGSAAARGPHVSGNGYSQAPPPLAASAAVPANAEALASSAMADADSPADASELVAAQIFKARQTTMSRRTVGLVVAGILGFVVLTITFGRGGDDGSVALQARPSVDVAADAGGRSPTPAVDHTSSQNNAGDVQPADRGEGAEVVAVADVPSATTNDGASDVQPGANADSGEAAEQAGSADAPRPISDDPPAPAPTPAADA